MSRAAAWGRRRLEDLYHILRQRMGKYRWWKVVEQLGRRALGRWRIFSSRADTGEAASNAMKAKAPQKRRTATRYANRVLFWSAVKNHLLYKLALLAFIGGLALVICDVAEDLGLMLVNLSLTVLVIDFLSEKRNQFSRRQEYIANMGSNNNDFAIQGIENLRAGGGLVAGSLRGAKYLGANWTGADLSGANLRDAELLDVDLTDANLKGVDLEGATLTDELHQRVRLPKILPDSVNLRRVSAEWIIAVPLTPSELELRL